MARSHQPVELWAGIECTHNRVGNRRFDQLVRTRHRDRIDDLDALNGLGVRAVRYPVLWEHVYGDDGARRDWRWHDERLQRLRELDVTPVVGLLHHGAGPGDAGFADPRFPERFAAFAREVAERYPWVHQYIPINEPLTTARFCGLYGVWHPHGRDTRLFAKILMAQLRATVLAMRAIREVVPKARLIQNEDIGFMRAVPHLQYQAEFENERRWVTFDLLCGRLREGMPMWEVLVEAGVSEDTIAWFAEDAVRPDVVAVDTYITSERFIDDRLHLYPQWSHGTNGKDRYADIESVRVAAQEPAGILPMLRQAWDRYGIPMVVGEWHLGCTREEQLRWLRDGWASVLMARNEGVDVRALTVWSVFGSYDWNTLVTQENGYYEPGLFDVRSDPPRPTALASMVRALATGESFDHPALESDGWWRRDDRFTYDPVSIDAPVPYGEPALPKVRVAERRSLVLTGARDALADGFARVCSVRSLEQREADVAEAADPA
ncbi:MAG TPA: family 1 glycosylhydrolase, partial [Actinomycetota bacterium]|nr:family 1 glycosylhydrolase [Actinomycetota bacterium]